MSKFKVGDRFAYDDENRNQGLILQVNELAGTVEAAYFEPDGYTPRRGTHTLAESKLINLSRGHEAHPSKVDNANVQKGCEKFDPSPYFASTSRFQWPASTPQEVLGTSKPDKRTEQLLNELYHDRARLEKIVASAVDLLTEIGEVDTDSDDWQDYAYALAGRVDQFIADHA